ncbi:MAG: hypothetical protein J6R18_00350 [Kiritimatiellae bacterium]|nr:hypothetical protein [Kiritimatiellia bacterium]
MSKTIKMTKAVYDYMMERATDFGACENLKEVAELEAVSNGMGEWNASGVKMTRKAYEFVMGELMILAEEAINNR